MSWIRRLLGTSPGPRSSTPDIPAIVARYKHGLMASAGVVTVGLGEDEDGEPTIIVGVTTTPEEPTSLPRSLEGVPVVTRHVGNIRAQDGDA